MKTIKIKIKNASLTYIKNILRSVSNAEYNIQGRLSVNGEITSSTSAATTDFINLGNATRISVDYYYSKNDDYNVGALYDENGNFICALNSSALGQVLNPDASGSAAFPSATITISIANILANASASGTPSKVRFTNWSTPNIPLNAKLLA